MEYINIEIEEKFLKCIFFNKELMIKTMHRGSLPKEIFADKSLRFIYQILNYHFIKNGTLANVDILKSNINRLSLKIKLSKNKQDENKDAKLFQEKLYAATDRVFAIEPDSEVYDNFSTYMNELVILMKARSLQEFNMQLFNHLDNAKLDEAEQLVSTFNMPVYGDDVDSSEFTENFAERENEVMKKVDNPDKYKLYSTGIPKLDGILGGGIDREFGVIGGSSNAGKSFLLQHLSLVGYLNKLNIILFTIEMRKIPVQNRLDCAIAGINYNFFRNPALYYNQKTHDKWKRII
jgi:replicative DNA helicase